MKLTKQILEAVNRGIKFALDDYQDIEPNSSISSTNDVIDAENIISHHVHFYGIIKKLGVEIVPKKDINNLITYSKEHNIKYCPTDKDDLTRVLHIFLNQYNHEDLNWIDTSGITDMSWLFANSVFNGDISEWDTSNVLHMDHMFENNQIFNCDISKWDVSNVVSACRMFCNASNFNQDLSQWNPCNLEDGIEMFYGTTNLRCNLGSWKLYKCRRFGDMFTNSGLTLRGFNSPQFFER